MTTSWAALVRRLAELLTAIIPGNDVAESRLKASSEEAGPRPTPTLEQLGSIVECATADGGKQPNQDFCERRHLIGCSVLAIADGVGESRRAELAAMAAVEGFLDRLEQCWNEKFVIGRSEIDDAYHAACAKITNQVDIELRRQSPVDNGASGNATQRANREGALGLDPMTTLIAVVELQDRFIFTYVGDGAITLFRAAGDTCCGLVVPHSGPLGLTRVLTASGNPPRHAYIEVDKTLEDGEIVVVGTDGALPPGRVYGVSQRVVAELRAALLASHDDPGAGASAVRTCLQSMVRDEVKTDDNRTLGVVLTRAALSLWRHGAGRYGSA